MQGVLEKKGWNKPDGMKDVIKNYADLERQYRSGDKVMLPKDDAKPEEIDAFYNKLGRPKTADEYRAPQGADEATVKALAPELHKLGITQKQFEALAKIDLSRSQTAINAENERFVGEQSAAMSKLQTEWGAKFNENIEVNRRAMRNLGISVDDATKMMQAGGTEKFMRLLNLAGAAAREDNMAGLGEAQLGFGMTPNRAKAELSAKKMDLLMKARNGDKGASAELDRLYKIAEGYAGA